MLASTGQVDVWALGISAVEMAEVAPPRWAVHPMRVIFMISRDPPPQLADRDRWSLPFHDFVAQCLQKVATRPRWSLPFHDFVAQCLQDVNTLQRWSLPFHGCVGHCLQKVS